MWVAPACPFPAANCSAFLPATQPSLLVILLALLLRLLRGVQTPFTDFVRFLLTRRRWLDAALLLISARPSHLGALECSILARMSSLRNFARSCSITVPLPRAYRVAQSKCHGTKTLGPWFFLITCCIHLIDTLHLVFDAARVTIDVSFER